MKRKIYLFCLISIIVLCTSCQQKINNNLSKETTVTETTTSESNAEYTDTSFSSEEEQWSDCETGFEQSAPNSDIINYTGDCIVDEKDFEIFEKYYEKASSILASNIRKAICRVDEVLFLNE